MSIWPHQGSDEKSPAATDGHDAFERRLILEALKARKPVLGICRGAQMLNVSLGGTLHQDAYGHYVDSEQYRTIVPRKTIRLNDATLLATISGTASMRVHALHSQSVDRLAAGLQVAARDDGGMKQAIEKTDDPLAIGVQWHPEHLFICSTPAGAAQGPCRGRRYQRCW